MTETAPLCPICGQDCYSTPRPTSCCWSHYEIEPLGENPYRVCFECGHVYRTPADLVAAHNDTMAAIRDHPPAPLAALSPPPPKTVKQADKIFCCQECLHDF